MTDLDTGPSSIRDDSICESSLPPNKSSGDIGERLKTDALSTSRATKMIAASKTEGNQAAGDPWALYEGLEPEQTLQWQAAAEIERLRRELAVYRLFEDDSKCLALLLHLTTAISGFDEGPFRAGFEMAIEEGGAYLDAENKDGGTQAQTLMEQMIGLVSGVYALTEIKGPMGVVAEEKSESRWRARALSAESAVAAAWDCIEKLEGGHQLLLAAVKAGDPLNEIVWRIEEELRVIARASAIRAKGQQE